MVQKLKLLPRYLINLGPLNGFLLFLKVELCGLNEISIPDLQFPINWRPDTSDIKVFREIFLFRSYELPQLINSQVIIDAGVNIGLSRVYFKHIYQDSRIFAIEPESENFIMLQAKEVFSHSYASWISRIKVLVIEVHDWIREGCSMSFFSAISKFRFSMQIQEVRLVLTDLDLVNSEINTKV